MVRAKIHSFYNLTVTVLDVISLVPLVACQHNTLGRSLISFWLALGNNINWLGLEIKTTWVGFENNHSYC